MIQMGGVTTLDNLHYTYDPAGAQLQAANDDATTDYGQGDFQDGNTSATDYTYDPKGNLSVDQNKDITRADYTHFDKPSRISFGSGCTYNGFQYRNGNLTLMPPVEVQPSLFQLASFNRSTFQFSFLYK